MKKKASKIPAQNTKSTVKAEGRPMDDVEDIIDEVEVEGEAVVADDAPAVTNFNLVARRRLEDLLESRKLKRMISDDFYEADFEA